jgi:hypothetical protein
MKFCPKCGRQRTSSRFCGGCGNDFGEQTADRGIPLAAEPIGEPVVEPVAQAPAPPAQAPARNPFAPSFAEPSPPDEAGSPRDDTAGRWEMADTIYAKPAQSPGYPPPPPPAYSPPPQLAPAFPPPSGPEAGRRGSGGGRRAAFIVVVVLVVLAAGGGAYALVSRSSGNATAQPPSQPTVTADATAAAVGGQASASPTMPASASPSASPSASATPSPSPSPTHTGTVQVAAGVASNPATPQVEALLNRYFSSINTKNYSAWNSLLDAQMQQGDSQSTFDSGYATTKDSNEVLTGITDTGGGGLTADVSFTSRQSPADSINHSACNDWQLSLFLVPQGGGYVQTAPPNGYHAAYTDC